MQLRPHSLLQDGKYEIIRALGQGGFGITYLAEQTLIDRKVCIKEFFIKEYCERDEATSQVSLGTASNAEMMERYMSKFIKEAKTIAKLDHPNIVRIHDVFKENATAYIVMEYIDGMSLGEYIRERGPLSESKAVIYIRQVGEALSFAHTQHIMHLDVKPSNIMLDMEHDRPVLIDFGLAKQYTEGGEQTSSTPVGISQGYAPLEQYQTGGVKEFSPATDVYSLGATLYKLLTGDTPPSASEVNEEGLPSMPDTISASVRQAIDKAMQPRRKDRPKSVALFLSILDTPITEKPTIDDENEEEVTIISKPIPSTAGRLSAPKPQTQVQEKKKPLVMGPSRGLSPSGVTEKLNTKRRLAKYGIIVGGAVLLAICLVLLFTHGNKSGSDSILINGLQVCAVEIESAAEEKEFKIEKNFEERWSYSGVPEWCAIKADTGRITLSVSENQTKEERTATIVFQKKDGKSTLAQLSIRQKANRTASKEVIKEYGSVRFDSTPSGAAIWIDGKNTKKVTPAVIERIIVGDHVVQLVKDGYYSQDCVIHVKSKKRGVLSLPLIPNTNSDPQTQSASSELMKKRPNQQENIKNDDEEAVPYQLVEKEPSFQGGDANNFSKWVNTRLIYPEIAKENGIQGKVILGFTVNKDGTVSNIKVLRGVDSSLDKEAVRVVSMSPKWTPGMQGGIPSKVSYTFPVVFSLK